MEGGGETEGGLKHREVKRNGGMGGRGRERGDSQLGEKKERRERRDNQLGEGGGESEETVSWEGVMGGREGGNRTVCECVCVCVCVCVYYHYSRVARLCIRAGCCPLV